MICLFSIYFFWRLWKILTHRGCLDCRIFIILWFTTATESFEDYRPFDDRWLRIVTIRSLVALHVKSNAEKVNYQSDPGSLTVKAGELRKTTRNKLSFTCLLMLFLFLFPYFSYRLTAVCEKHRYNLIPSMANPKWFLFVDYKVQQQLDTLTN